MVNKQVVERRLLNIMENIHGRIQEVIPVNRIITQPMLHSFNSNMHSSCVCHISKRSGVIWDEVAPNLNGHY